MFAIDAAEAEVVHVRSPTHHIDRHPMRTAEADHPEDARHFHHDVAIATADAIEILVLGPASAKHELVKDWKAHDPHVAARVLGVETVDHPTDGQVVAFARRFFKAADRMTGNV